jgi:hypothetical protein
MKDKAIRFKVVGFGPFPLDMLRYDRATPYASTDAAEMKQAFGDSATHEIELVTEKENAPMFRRWESFGWKVFAVHRDGAKILRKRWLPEVYLQTFSTVAIYEGGSR